MFSLVKIIYQLQGYLGLLEIIDFDNGFVFKNNIFVEMSFTRKDLVKLNTSNCFINVALFICKNQMEFYICLDV